MSQHVNTNLHNKVVVKVSQGKIVLTNSLFQEQILKIKKYNSLEFFHLFNLMRRLVQIKIFVS